MIRHTGRGAAMVELVLALPIMCLMIFGGLIIAYYLFVKLSLTWYVHAESEKYALLPPVLGLTYGIRENLLPGDNPRPRGLRADRFSAHSLAVPLPESPLVVSAACYKMPVPLPRIRLREPLPAAAEPPAATLLARLQRLIDLANRYLGQAGDVTDDAEGVVDEVEFLRQLVSMLKSHRPDAQRQAARLLGSWVAEAGLERIVCGDASGWVVTATAVAWSEKTGVME